MKLASLKAGRDGRLVVVDRRLRHARAVPEIAPTLQAALEDWASVAPRLQAVADALEANPRADAFSFDVTAVASPLPRAFQWLDAGAYLSHMELARRARGAAMPPDYRTDPAMHQGASDRFLAPCEDIPLVEEGCDLDFEGELAVVTDDVPAGVSADVAALHIKLLMLVNDVTLRALVPGELAKGVGFVQSKPFNAFSPVAVTPDELLTSWRDGKVHRPLLCDLNGVRVGHPDAGVGMAFNFPRLLAHAARTRALAAGTILGSGTVSNDDLAVGACCLAEIRAREKVVHGTAATPFLRPGDAIRIEMLDTAGETIFGAIAQRVAKPSAAVKRGESVKTTL